LESIAGHSQLPNVSQASQRLKLSHFHSIAGGKQPSKMTSLQAVPEFSYSGDEQFATGFLLSIYLMVVYNNALWCNWTAINFFVCLWKQVALKDRQKGGREPSF